MQELLPASMKSYIAPPFQSFFLATQQQADFISGAERDNIDVFVPELQVKMGAHMGFQ